MKEHFLKYLLSLVAIVCNFYIFFDLTILIIKAFNAEENLGIVFLPLTISIHSMITFSVLGFLNLNKLKHSNKYIYVALTLSSVTMISMWTIIPIPYFMTGGLVFLVSIFLIMRYFENLNLIPLLVNLFILIATGFFLYIQV